MIFHHITHTFNEEFFIKEVSHTDTAAGHFVFIRGADTAAGRTDLLGTGGGFTGVIQSDVIRHHQGSVARDANAMLGFAAMIS